MLCSLWLLNSSFTLTLVANTFIITNIYHFTNFNRYFSYFF